MITDEHFKRIYQYITTVTYIVLAYVIAITFIPIPKESQRFVDISLAFLLGFLSSNSQYLTGGNPSSKKNEQKTTTEISPEGSTTITQEPVTTEKTSNPLI